LPRNETSTISFAIRAFLIFILKWFLTSKHCCLPSDFGLRTSDFLRPSLASLLLTLTLMLTLALTLPSLAPASPSEPFLRLRETTLGYHGSECDLTNLTEIRIGWFGPTNVSDPLTGDIWWAADFAIREANEGRTAGGGSEFRNLPFRLTPRWAVDPWGTGVSQLARMVYEERPLALLGSVDSASTHLAEQVVAKANLPLVSPIATDKSINLAGVSWMYSCAPSDTAIARALVEGVLGAVAGPDSKVVLLTCTDHESRMTSREVLQEFSRRGRLPDFRFELPPGARALGKHLSALERAKPSALVIIADVEDSARLVQALRRELPWFSGACQPSGGSIVPHSAPEPVPASPDPSVSGCLLFGSHAMGRTRFLELAGDAAEGVRFPLLCDPDRADPAGARFLARFAAERRRAPDYAAILAYDATRMLVEAVRRAGPNRARVRETLARLSPWPGLAGPIHFDGTGQNTRADIRLVRIQNGSIFPPPNTKIVKTNHTTAGL
jgi:ABC-type branched-subunit amino acid transport system substrate-binding protein